MTDRELLEAVYFEVEAEVRYWEDANINGVDDEAGTLVPFRFGKLWCPVIRLCDGRIIGWPEATTADIHYKVCDQGEYWLAREECRIAKWGGDYVPDAFLCHGSKGYGNYIIFKVGADGRIDGWERPQVNADDWHAIVQDVAATLPSGVGKDATK